MASRRLHLACEQVAIGRRAARAIASCTRAFGIGESDLRIIWQLGPCWYEAEDSTCRPLDQTTLASQLELSAAQISVAVERLRQAGLIISVELKHDRRRQLWQLSEAGHQLLMRVSAAFESTADSSDRPAASGPGSAPSMEDAA